MKVRSESSGLHIYDRNTGTHVLFDEVTIPSDGHSISPRSFSIALTNSCDLNCSYCYAPKHTASWDLDELCKFCSQIDQLGTLEITLGGGEPFLYPHLVEFCSWVWKNTSLGISITTHGNLIDKKIAQSLYDSIQSIRFSIDNLEPHYSKMKNRSLDNLLDKIEIFRNRVHIGFNILLVAGKIQYVTDVMNLALELGVNDVLLIPLHQQGKSLLSQSDLTGIKNIIDIYKNKIQINVSSIIGNSFDKYFLENAVSNEFEYAHITADGYIQEYSYGGYNVGQLDLSIFDKQLINLINKIELRSII